MNTSQSKSNWDNIPHMKIGEIPPSAMEGPINVVSLLVAKRLLLATNEDAKEDPQQAMCDAVANIMVLCCHLGINFESVLDSAQDSHNTETDVDEIVPKVDLDARHMPGHYHLEFNDDDDDNYEKYFNATLEECIQKIADTNRVLVRAGFICQFGCGQEHALSDNERVLLGLRPLEAGLQFWGGSGGDLLGNLLTSLSDADRPL
jgi:hypothetical protein